MNVAYIKVDFADVMKIILPKYFISLAIIITSLDPVRLIPQNHNY